MPHCSSSLQAQGRTQQAARAGALAPARQQRPRCTSSYQLVPQPLVACTRTTPHTYQPRSRLHATHAPEEMTENDPPAFSRLERSVSNTPKQPNGDDEPRHFAVAMASILNETKCQDIVVLDVSSLVSWTTYMVFGSVFSKPQLMAALGRVEKMAAEKYDRQQQNTPGNSPWECLDFGDCLLHVMSVEQRDFYDLESFYGAAEEVELPFEQEQRPTEDSVPQWTVQQPAV